MTRNRAIPYPYEGFRHTGASEAQVLDPSFTRGLHGGSNREYHEEMPETDYHVSGTRRPPPYSASVEERLASQYKDIQELLADNRMFAATHVALREELSVARIELEKADNSARELHALKDSEMRELLEKSAKKEIEIQAVNSMRSEIMKVHRDIKDLTVARQDLTAQVHMMTQELGRVQSDLRRIPAIKSEIDGLKHDLGSLRASTDTQKKIYAQSIEHSKVTESKLISITREVEKLKADLVNAEKRGVNNNSNYGHPGLTDSGNSFHQPYSVPATNSVVPGSEVGYLPYGPGHGTWGYSR